jgi:condensin-2 complex subunit G2
VIINIYYNSASIVRVAVLEGLKYLVENHLSQPLLKAMLPKLSPLIHDTTEKVRATFVELLITLKSIKMIKYKFICCMY